MSKWLMLSILVLLAGAAALAADTMTGIFNEYVKSLQVRVVGDEMAPPVIVLDTDDQLIISFDHLATEREYMRYQLVHCNANWQPSQLVATEYLDGFNEGIIENYEYSQMTTVQYVHYWLEIPNGEVRPKVSGNYLLRIYPESDPDEVWLQCRFMVSEQSAPISTTVTTRTDLDFNDAHQQLSIAVDTERSSVRDPFNDLIVMVQQDGRYDNEVALRQPLRMQGPYLSIYEHQPQLIFDAGNEYRRFETVSVLYPSMGVDEISYSHPYYHMTLYPDLPRAEERYNYDQTQYGRFKVREYNSMLSDIEADYVVVHFALEMPEIEDALIFIDGDFTCRRFDPESLMTFNRATGRYERAMLLKQGAYNYQYLTVPAGRNRGETAQIEGDKYETDHEYLVKVYARNPMDRYDRLIGVAVAYAK